MARTKSKTSTSPQKPYTEATHTNGKLTESGDKHAQAKAVSTNPLMREGMVSLVFCVGGIYLSL